MDLSPIDVERELQRVLRTRDTPLLVSDPVPAVRAGMRRRRRGQRLQVLSAGLAALVVAVGGILSVSQLSGPRPQPPAHGLRPAPRPAVVPPGFQAIDISFGNDSTGWALGSAPCRAGHCPWLLTTADGGHSWQRGPTPPAHLPSVGGTFSADCTTVTCVSAVRFAHRPSGATVGYAFGPGLMMTLDGGRSWTEQQLEGRSQVLALAVAGDKAIRVIDPLGGCPCGGVVVQQADLGTTSWRTVATTSVPLTEASFVQLGSRLVLVQRGLTGGGAQEAGSHLLLSSDDGASWTARGDPCPLSVTDEVDTYQLSLAAEGRVVALCRHRGTGPSFVRVSDDSGRTYHSGRVTPEPAFLLATPGRALLVATSAGRRLRLFRSTDDGRSWTKVATQGSATPYGSVSLHFDGSTGTWLGGDPRRLVRSGDAGRTWRDEPFR